MRTLWQAADGEAGTDRARSVVAPVSLVVTAFAPVNDVRRALTPELRGGGRELLLVDLGGGHARLGGSCLAQVFGQLGDAPPDLDDPHRLAAALRRAAGAGRRAQARRVPRSHPTAG